MFIEDKQNFVIERQHANASCRTCVAEFRDKVFRKIDVKLMMSEDVYLIGMHSTNIDTELSYGKSIMYGI